MAAVTEASSGGMVEFYNELWKLRDKRVDDWPFMSSPWPTLTLCAAYIYGSTVLGPTLMRDRQPFELKKTIQVYNVFQVILSAYVLYEACVSGWFSDYSWICQDVDRSTAPGSNGMRMAICCWIYYMSKFTEFADTFFFIARKKFAHVSMLQVVHHGIMPIFGWALCRWLPGGQESFGGTLNSLVHVLMYSYYFLAALGPHMQKYLWWKRYLTTFQMIQFTVVFFKSMVIVTGYAECGYPWQFSLITCILMLIFFGLFAQFYIQAYLDKSSKPKPKKA